MRNSLDKLGALMFFCIKNRLNLKSSIIMYIQIQLSAQKYLIRNCIPFEFLGTYFQAFFLSNNLDRFIKQIVDKKNKVCTIL